MLSVTAWVKAMHKLLAALWLIGTPVGAADLTVLFTHENHEFANVLASFERTSGITIDARWIDQAELKVKLVREADGGKLPDAVIMPADHLGLHNQTRLSAIAESWIDANIQPQALATTLVDGHHYGIPLLMGNHLLLYYNKQLVNQPATSWAEMAAQDREFKKQGLSAIRWSFSEMYWFTPFLGAFGGWPMADGQVTLNTPAMVRALGYYWQLHRDGLVPSDCDYECAFNAFVNGKTAYSYNGIWAQNQYLNALGDNLGIALLPTVEGKPMVPMYSSIALAFPNNAAQGPKKDKLEQLARYLQSETGQRLLWQVVRDFPAHSKVAAEITTNASGNTRVILDQLKQAQPMPSDFAMSYAWEAMGKGFTRYGAGILSAEDAAQLMQQLADKSTQRHH